MSGKAGRPSSASPAQAPAPWWRGSRRRCGWWPSRSWPNQILEQRRKSTWRGRWWSGRWWGQEVGLRSPVLAVGLLFSIHSQPFPCIREKIIKSFFPCSKLTQDVFSILSKRSSASQCSQRWPRSTEKEGYVWLGLELLGTHHGSFSASWNMERFMEHESHHGTCHGLHHRSWIASWNIRNPPQKLRLHPDSSSFDSARLL